MCMLIKVHKAPINNIRIKSALKDHNTTVDECIIYSTEMQSQQTQINHKDKYIKTKTINDLLREKYLFILQRA